MYSMDKVLENYSDILGDVTTSVIINNMLFQIIVCKSDIAKATYKMIQAENQDDKSLYKLWWVTRDAAQSTLNTMKTVLAFSISNDGEKGMKYGFDMIDIILQDLESSVDLDRIPDVVKVNKKGDIIGKDEENE